MKRSNIKGLVWIIIIIVMLVVGALIIEAVNHFNEISKVVAEIEKASTFDKIILVHEKYEDKYFGEEDRVEKSLDEINYNYLKENYSNINGICLPYYIPLQDDKMSPNYKMPIIYIKDLNNVYILPSDLMCKIEKKSDGTEKVVFNELYYDISNNIVKIENISNIDNYKFRINGSSASDEIKMSTGDTLPASITYFLDSVNNDTKHIWLELDKVIANKFFHKYQEYLKQYYTILPKDDIVYVYSDKMVAVIECGHEDTGYFMMISFNYSDKYNLSN